MVSKVTGDKKKSFAAVSRRVLDRRFGSERGTVRDILRLTVFFVTLSAVTTAAVFVDWTPGETSLVAGDIAQKTYKADRDFTYVSEIRTEEARREAGSDVNNIVKAYDPEVREDALGDLRSFISSVTEVRDSDSPESEKIEIVQTALPDLTDEEATLLVQVSPAAWETIASQATILVDETMEGELQSDGVAAAQTDLSRNVSSLLTTTQQDLAVAIASAFLRPNVFIDDEATQAKRQAAIDEVEPVVVSVKAGQAIVRDGDAITERDIEALEALGLLRSRLNPGERIGVAAMMIVLTIALTAYLFLFSDGVWRNRQLILVGLVVIGPVVAARILLPHPDIQYMLPVAASAMLLAILVNIQFATVIAMFIAMYLGVIVDLSFELTLLYFVGSVAGAAVIHRADRTIDFVWAGIALTLASFAVGLSITLVAGGLDGPTVGRILIETSLAGALAASVTFLSFSVLGSIFGILTNLQLQELAHPRQPLLQRLAQEAPGTYHHSIIVSNLAEAAATSVDADPLFARVAVLYHDIGKIEHPTFFIENQANIGNVHDGLDPQVSAQIIIDHVRDGVRMAKKHRLPISIVDAIEQHHGTTRVEYFYQKANNLDEDVDPADFTYPGPRPQTREAAIIMLADSVEAAVRSMAQSGRLFEDVPGTDRKSESERLVEFVHGIIKSRVDNGQLDDCDLTFNDVNKIETSFIQILEGIYHPRLEYPKRAAGQEVETGPLTEAATVTSGN
ncbi:HDIG domain-containing protein [soil metagenome]